MKLKKSINIKIGGKAGEGVKVTGLILAKSLTRHGYSTFSYQEYPSLIRGGHNVFQVHAGIEPVYSQIKKVDILVAFDQNTIKEHQSELNSDSLILYDPAEFALPKIKLIGHYLPLKLIELAEKAGGKPIMANMVALGAVLTLLALSVEPLKQIVKEIFISKGKEIVLLNQKAIESGENFSKNIKNYPQNAFKIDGAIAPLKLNNKKGKRMVITGNEAVALGALSAGLKFYTAYPMTPSTSILHFLAANEQKANLVVKQPEDEIAAINQAVGASFMGVRAMTATSGGGFCLMTEGLGLAAMTETPLVVVNATRPGPSSGMPTWSGQGDLKFMLFASQDEFPRVVLAPGDAQECFDLTRKAFYLSEKYQIPVIILLDKNISESYYSPLPFTSKYNNQRYSFTQPKKGFLRYKITETGISPRCFVGEKNGAHLANSYEHRQDGLVTEDGEERNKMMDKRMAKLKILEKEILPQSVFGDKKTEISLISWGSNKGPILEALKTTKRLNYFHLNWLWPFPQKQVSDFVQSAKKVVCLEANATGQLASLIREYTGFKVEKFLKYDGRPFFPNEIIRQIASIKHQISNNIK